MLNYWEKDFEQSIEKHKQFLKENLDNQENYNSRFSQILEEIYDFEQFSWAPLQDFSKNTLLLERYSYIFSIFPCFSCFDQVLERYLWCFGISLMLF